MSHRLARISSLIGGVLLAAVALWFAIIQFRPAEIIRGETPFRIAVDPLAAAVLTSLLLLGVGLGLSAFRLSEKRATALWLIAVLLLFGLFWIARLSIGPWLLPTMVLLLTAIVLVNRSQPDSA